MFSSSRHLALVALCLFSILNSNGVAARRNRNTKANGNGNSRAQAAAAGQAAAATAATGAGAVDQITQNAQPRLATDGSSVIVDMTANIQGIPLRFKVSAPQAQFKTSGGGAAAVQKRERMVKRLRQPTAAWIQDVRGAQAAAASAQAGQVAPAAQAPAATAQAPPVAGQASPATAQGTAPPATAAPPASAAPGLNVLLHGDGGQSFFDFPNQALQSNLMGVVALAPNQNRFWGGGSGLNRTDGALHASLVNSLITDVLPQMLTFDPTNVQFTGVSGGSLLLSGFFVPQFSGNFAPTNVLLNCGGMAPQVQPAANFDATKTKIHFQSTGQELDLLKGSIPQSITAYTGLAAQAGLQPAQIDTLITGDAQLSAAGGHCEFDGRDFVSGVQLMADSFSNVMLQGGTGQVNGVNVLKSVVQNPNIFNA